MGLGIGLELGLDLVPGALLGMHVYLYYFRLTLSHSAIDIVLTREVASVSAVISGQKWHTNGDWKTANILM